MQEVECVIQSVSYLDINLPLTDVRRFCKRVSTDRAMVYNSYTWRGGNATSPNNSKVDYSAPEHVRMVLLPASSCRRLQFSLCIITSFSSGKKCKFLTGYNTLFHKNKLLLNTSLYMKILLSPIQLKICLQAMNTVLKHDPD